MLFSHSKPQANLRVSARVYDVKPRGGAIFSKNRFLVQPMGTRGPHAYGLYP